MKNYEEKIILNILKECDSHKRMIEYQLSVVGDILNNREKLLDLDNESKSHIDSLIFRFSKLQDTISQRLFRFLMEILGEDIDGMSFIDILNKLEKLEVIPSAEKWLELRKIRNLVTHEYEINLEEIIEEMRIFKDAVEYLLDVYQKIKKYTISRIKTY